MSATTTIATQQLRFESRWGWNAAIGGAVWIVYLAATRPNPFDPAWTEALLTLAALVFVPAALRVVSVTRDASILQNRMLIGLQLVGAICLQVSFLQPQGFPAAALAVPWLVWSAVLATIGLKDLIDCGWRWRPEVCFDVAMVYIVIGAGWTVLSRASITPLGFKPIIVLLTGIHFHYAGFVLPIVVGACASAIPSRGASVTCGLVLASVPMTAAGITSTQLGGPPVIESVAALSMSLGGLAAAVLLWRAFRGASVGEKLLARFAAVSLSAAMGFSILYGLRFLNLAPWLDIPWMRVLHGTTNALGFAGPALAAWNLRRRGAPTRCLDATHGEE